MRFLYDRVRYAERGSEERREEIALNLRLARQADSIPLIALLVRWTAKGVAARSIQDYLRVPGADAEACWERLGAMLHTSDESERIRRAFVVERTFGIWVVRGLIEGRYTEDALVSSEFLETYTSPFRWHLRAQTFEDGIRMLEMYDQILTNVVLPPRAARTAGQALEAQVWPSLAKGFVSLATNVADIRIRCVATMRVARVGLAIRATYARTGVWPQSLDAVRDMVGEEDLENPYTGERLRYEPGVVLTADGARPQDEKDTTWQFSRSP